MGKCDTLHDKVPELGYLAEQEDAEQRMANREDQTLCPYCRLYVWNSYFHHLLGKPIVKHLGGRNYQLVGHEPPTANPQYASAAQQPKVERTCLNCLLRETKPLVANAEGGK